MTGNNKFWRASLAGLASVAMLATMGVSAANAATTPEEQAFTSFSVAASYQVKVYDASKPYQEVDHYTRAYGQVVTAADLALYNQNKKYVVDYLSYDQAGTEKVATPYVVTGDVKLFAHYKEAVTVSFDLNSDGKIDDTNDVSVNIPKGTALTAAEYDSVINEPVYPVQGTVTGSESTNIKKPARANNETGSSVDVFAGWTTDYTLDASTSSNLYTGAVLNEDTVLYPRWDNANVGTNTVNSGKNLAKINFRNAGATAADKTGYTLSGKAFPAFRAPAGTWKVALEGADYDFNTPVVNKDGNYTTVDTTVVKAVSGNAQDVTVTFHFNNNGQTAYKTVGVDNADGRYTGTGDATLTTTADQKIAEPVAPVATKAVFTGWYTNPSVNGESNKFDFSKSVDENFKSASGNVDLWAGWDKTNVSAFEFKLGYRDWTNATQVWFVRPGKSYDLPKLEEYFQTADQNNANKGEYTTRQLTGWKWGEDTVTKATAPANKVAYTLKANWVQAASVKLDANGGKFGEDTVKWVTKNPDQKWADVAVTPTWEGHTFVQWSNLNKVGSYVEGKLFANLSDGYWYDVATGKTTKIKIADGDALKAEWKLTSDVDIAGLRNRFFSAHTAADRTDSIKKVANYGYTEESAAKYVDAVNSLEPEYKALESLSGDKLVDATNALAAKYYAAEALLVKSDVPVEPTPAQKVPVYRLYNPGLAQVAQHLYTTNVDEYNRLQQSEGWKGEGIVFYTTSDKTAAPVYRLYNQYTSEHFLTSDKAEWEDLYQNKGWTNEGVAWYIPSDGTADLFRLQNPVSFEHLYTTNAAEKDNLTANAGWVLEGAPYKVYAK